jgi:hypothetical protein
MFREGTVKDGIEVGRYYDEETAKDRTNKAISNTVGSPVTLRWFEHPGNCAISELLTLKSIKFKDVEPNRYFFFADDIKMDSAPCICGKQALPAGGNRRYKCDFCTAPEFYYHHCKGCGARIDSRKHQQCGRCSWYICSVCGTCNC